MHNLGSSRGCPQAKLGDGDLPRTYISIPETRCKRPLGEGEGRIGESRYDGSAFGAVHEEAGTG
jgi:hypothetical protein